MPTPMSSFTDHVQYDGAASQTRPILQESASLERLVTHFVAAKRSLSATGHVYRANEIVSIARGLIEETAVLGAKNTFLKRGVSEEANALGAIRDGLDSVARDGNDDFKSVVKCLDIANERLQATLRRLQETIVDHRLGSKLPEPAHDQAHDQAPELSPTNTPPPTKQKTLHDFIHESTHLDLLDALYHDIDSYNDAQNTFQASQDGFDTALRKLDAALHEADEALSSRDPQAADDTANEPLSRLFHDLTSHATEAASLLQSLISHYDLCTTALKHTEGGGEAARAIANDPSIGQNPQGLPESFYADTKSLSPISEDERQEMLAVLENDAQEVEDVVLELRDRLAEMEAQLPQLTAHAHAARRAHTRLAHVLTLLHDIAANLPAYVTAARTFSTAWAALKDELVRKTADLSELTNVYDSFVHSYGLLLRELGRRQVVDARIQRIAEKAKRDIDALYEDDLARRNDFFADVGESLPSDICPGLMDVPPRWEVRPVAEMAEGEVAEGEVGQQQQQRRSTGDGAGSEGDEREHAL